MIDDYVTLEMNQILTLNITEELMCPWTNKPNQLSRLFVNFGQVKRNVDRIYN